MVLLLFLVKDSLPPRCGVAITWGMKPFFLVLFLALPVSLSLTSCGPSSDSDAGPTLSREEAPPVRKSDAPDSDPDSGLASDPESDGVISLEDGEEGDAPDSQDAPKAKLADGKEEKEGKEIRAKARPTPSRPVLADASPQEVADGWVRPKVIMTLDPKVRPPLPEPGSIDLNDPKVTVEQIDRVPWIGPPLARALVAGRPYPDLETVMEVRGMSPKLYEQIKVYIVFPKASGRKAPPKDATLPF
jgi:DNA uptake protein ComE-like DNA-binding protein